MVVGVKCEARVRAHVPASERRGLNRQCSKGASTFRRANGQTYRLCGTHGRLPTSQLHLTPDDPEKVTALYHRIHPRSGRDGKGA